MTRRIGFLFVVLSLITLAGCASFGDLKKGLGGLMGENVKVAIGVLGQPSNKQQLGEKTVYSWTRNEDTMVMVPLTVPVGNGYTTTDTAIPVHYHCNIRLISNASGKLIKWKYDGNLGGCKPYMRLLDDFAKKHKQEKTQQAAAQEFSVTKPSNPNYDPAMEKRVHDWYVEFGICCDINATSDGETGPMIMLEKFQDDMVQYLVKNGYDRRIKNNAGETAYDMAVRLGANKKTIDMLRPPGYVGPYDLTPEQKNIVDRDEADAVRLYLSRSAKELAGDVDWKKVFRKDVNGDGKKDLLVAIGVTDIVGGGNHTVLYFIGELIQTANGKYTYLRDVPIKNVYQMEFKTLKMDGDGFSYIADYYKPNDAQCCPTGRRKGHFKLPPFATSE